MEKLLHILHLEDNENDSLLIRSVLETEGYVCKITSVDNKRTFSDAIESGDIDLILSDYSLPSFNGLTALKITREKLPEVPFIFVSGTMGEDSAVESMKAGAYDYVMKSNLKRLIPAIERAIREAATIRAARKAEEALSESQALYQSFVEHLPASVFRKDSEGRYVFVNSRFCQLKGLNEDEILGRTPGELAAYESAKDSIRPAEMKGTQRTLAIQGADNHEQIMRTGKPIELEEVYPQPDGTKQYFQVMKSPVFDSDGKIIGTQGVQFDITQHKRAEEALRESEERYRQVVESATEIIFSADVNGRFTNANYAALKTVGFSLEELCTRHHLDLVLPEHRQRVNRTYQRQFLARESTSYVEYPFRTKSGETKWFGQNGSLVFKDERVVGFNLIARDITERKRAEEALRASVQLFQGLFNASPDAIVLIDPHSTDVSWPIVDCNEAACQMSGYTHGELAGQSIDVLNATTGTPQERLAYFENLRREHTVHLETSHRHKDGHIFPVEVTTSIITLAGREMVLGIDRDITERKRADQAIRDSEERFRALTTFSPDAIYVHVDGRVTLANPAMCRLLGAHDPSELIGKSVFDLVHPQYHAVVNQRMNAALDGRPAPLLEEQFVRLDGTPIDVEVTAVAIDWEGSKGVQVIARDITDRKRVEEALRSSETQLSSAMKMAHLGPWEYNVATDLFTFNDHIYTMFRTTAGRVGGYTMSSAQYAKRFVHPDDMAILGNEIQKALEATDPNYSGHLEHRIIYADGETGYITVRIFIVKDAQGRTIRTYGVNQDITERKRAEEAMRETEERFRMVFENVFDGISIYDEDPDPSRRKLIECNERYAVMAGRSREELLKLGSTQALQKTLEESANELRLQGLATRGEFRGSYSWIRPDGKDNTIEYVGMPITWRGKSFSIGIDRDVTERKRAEEELKVSEDKFRAIFKNNSTSIAIIDPDTTISMVNDAYCQNSGYTEQEIVGMSWTQMVAPEDRERLKEYNRQRFTKDIEVPSKYEFKFQRKDGEQRYGLMSVSMVPSIRKIVTSITDITDRKLAEEALTYERNLLRALMDTVPDHVYFKDERSRFIRISKAHADHFGLDDPELAIGKTDFDFFSQDHARPAYEMEQLIMKTGKPVENLEEKEKWPDGRETWVSTTKVPLRDVNGHIIGTFGISRDITKHKKAEEILRNSEERLRILFEFAPDSYYLYDLKGKFVDGNRMAEQTSGYARAELIGQSFLTLGLLSGKDLASAARILAQNILGRSSGPDEVVMSRKDGKKISLEIRTFPIKIGGQTLVLGIAREITERKRAEESLRLQGSALRAAANSIVITDRDGIVQWINPAFSKMTGYAEDEIIGKNPRILNSGIQDAAFYRNVWETILSGGVWHGEIVNKRKDGGLYHEEMTITPLVDNYNRVMNFIAVKQDITERKQAEEALRRFELLSENTREIILFVRKEDGRIIEANKAAATSYGYSRSELLSLSLRNLRDPSVLKELVQQMNEADEKGIFFETIHRRKDGTTFPVEVSSKGAMIGKTRVLMSIVRNISERKTAESELRKNRELLNTILEASRDGIALEDDRATIAFANSAYARMFGYENPNELIGKVATTVQAPQDRQRLSEYSAKRLRRESVPSLYEFKGLRKDGALIDLEVSVTTTTIDGKKNIMAVLRDIAMRKKAEEQVRLLVHTIKCIAECVSITDLNNELLFVNDALLKTYGYDEGELIGRNISVLRSVEYDESQLADILEVTVRGGWHGEQINRRKDGSEFPVWLSTSVVKDENGQPVALVGVATDISDRKETEKRHRSLEDQVAQSQKMEAIGTLAGGIAHDFNNILGIILGHASLLARANTDPSIIPMSVDTITKAVQRGAGIVRQILTFARRTDATREPVDVNASIEEISRMLRETFPRTIDIIVEPRSTFPIISVDSTQLQQTLMNLCINARDAMIEASATKSALGTLTIRTGKIPGNRLRTTFADAKASDYVTISVSDTGTGIDEATRKKIFEPFFTTKPVGKGTGLGLAVVYGVVKSHDGFIDLQSEVGKGSTFTLYFPSATSFVTDKNIPASPEAARLQGKETIFIVEDEESIVLMLKKIFERAGYTVISAKDGIEAMETFEKRSKDIDIVITDIGLPRLDGKEVFAKMRQQDPDVKVILASGYLDPEFKSELLKAGAKDFLQKPYDPKEVLKRIREILDA